MQNKFALGLGIVAIILSLIGLYPHKSQIADPRFGATQTYPNHVSQSATALDTLFLWGGQENDGTAWFDGAVNISGAGSLTVTGTVALATTTISGHLITSGNAPTLSTGGLGYSVVATVPVAGSSDADGTATATIATANAGLLKFTFNTLFAAAPNCVVSSANSQAATDTFFVTSTVDAFSINFPAGLTGGVHQYVYECVQ